jgi:putative membrane protein
VFDPASKSEPAAPDGLISSQFSWIRTEFSNVRTMLSWVRTSVSMIGFGFTIYNFYSGFFEELGTERVDAAARNLGLALVGFGTVAMVVALWNFWSVNQYLDAMSRQLQVPAELKRHWFVSYGVAAVILVIGVITFLFMMRII